jgi:Fe-S cluster biogenesis protein NfuA
MVVGRRIARLDGPGLSGFKSRRGGSAMDRERVQEVLDRVRPALQADGGDVELVEIDGGVVKVRLQGACAGCPMSQLTLSHSVERVLKSEIPEVERVEPVI